MGLQPVYAKQPHHLPRAGSRATRGPIMRGIPNGQNYSVIFIVHNNLRMCTWAGLEVNADKTKYIIMSRDQNAGRSYSMKTDNS